MSRAPHYLQTGRFGQKMGDTTMVDGLTGILTDPFGNGIMGITAENVAVKYDITRQDQDAFALESQRRTAAAMDAGHFRSQILPVEIAAGRKTVIFDRDERSKPASTLESLAALRTAFKKDGTVTAGNASGINDGAAAVVLASEDYAKRSGLSPLARIVPYAHAGEPGWRRHRARPPSRGYRSDADGQGALPPRKNGQAAWSDHDVHWRRTGYHARDRTLLSSLPRRAKRAPGPVSR